MARIQIQEIPKWLLTVMNNLYEIADNLSYQTGKHAIRAGAGFLYNDDTITFPRSIRGSYSFSPSITPDGRQLSSLDNFRSGNYSGFSQTFGNPVITQTNPNLGLFAQDEWHIVPETFSLTAGSKFEYNSFGGFEVQPTGRFTWLPGGGQTVWGAVSRAVRTPTRIDQNFVAPNPFPSPAPPPFLIANPDFDSEKLIAYEIGYRIKPANNLSFDLAVYYNDYDDIRSVEPQSPSGVILQNNLAARSYGGSLGAKWRIADWWRVDGSVSYLQLDFHLTAAWLGDSPPAITAPAVPSLSPSAAAPSRICRKRPTR
jgi:outer membrane receptor protein involved in Fe transport